MKHDHVFSRSLDRGWFYPLLLGVICHGLSLSTAGAQSLPEAISQRVTTLLNTRTLEPQAPWSGWVSPGRLGTTPGDRSAQIRAANQLIASEVTVLTSEFVTAPVPQKSTAALAALAQIDPATARERARRVFFSNAQPFTSIVRAFNVVPQHQRRRGVDVFNALTIFEQLPKPEDIYYRYADPFSLVSGYLEQRGRPGSHLEPGTPLQPGDTAALKKCRDTWVGWFCNTNQYSVHQFSGADLPEGAFALVATLADLTQNPDHPDFRRHRRNENTSAGTVSITWVVPSGNDVLVYYIGVQHAARDMGFHDRIDQGLKLEHQQLTERLNRL